ncbi:MAG TPA: DUF2334 domain-containing protein [Chloroflexota bacterium]|nr:DUF2334 domain-containing protein [Chloroflexota bacterium]
MVALVIAAGLAILGAAAPLAASFAQGASEPHVLLVNQYSPSWPEAGEARGRQLEMLLRHFTSRVTRISDAAYAAGGLSGADYVVVAGNDALAPLPAVLLADLAQAGRPLLWVGYGLAQLPVDTAKAFGFTLGYWTGQDVPDRVSYRGHTYPLRPLDYAQLQIVSPAVQVLSTYYQSGRAPIPYVLHSGHLWYVNGLATLAEIGKRPLDPQADAPTLIIADVLHDFLGRTGEGPTRAVIRLEGVSVDTDPARLLAAVDLLHEQAVPFVIGLTAAQPLARGGEVHLRQRPALVRALRHAQSVGATIALHRAADESLQRAVRDLGLRPRLWETSGPDASPLAYAAIGPKLPPATEDQATWLPYPIGTWQYETPFGLARAAAGAATSSSPVYRRTVPQMLLPRSLGAGGDADDATMAAQLERARLLKIVRERWLVTSHDPARGSLADLAVLCAGLRRDGYILTDLSAIAPQVEDPYGPGILTRLTTWLTVDRTLITLNLNLSLEEAFDRWSFVQRIPWSTILTAAAVVLFFVRLRQQWRPATARSLVEPAGTSQRRSRNRPRLQLAALIGFGALAVATSAGALGLSSLPAPRHYNLAGWSSIQWSVIYDGYGSVGIDADGSLRLTPFIATRPDRTHAALVLGGERTWHDYRFTVRMMTQAQLRQHSPPNPWEAGWLFFRYQAPDRSYYLVHKPNGLELGKLAPPAGKGQVFLVTAPEWPLNLERWYEYRVELNGPTILVYIDGELALSYTDPDPILSGRVGLYTEDAEVYFLHPAVSLS